MNIHAFYKPILGFFRKGRMRLLSKLFPIEKCSILDVGGDVFNWELSKSRPLRLTILNIYDHSNKAAWADYVVADGCDTKLPPASFDLVFSNSVIEHVGGLDRQRQFASECMRCGRSYFVQTPNRWFPIDTHTLLPFAHWLPQKLFRKMIPWSPRFWFFRPDQCDLEDFRNMHLLTKREMRLLFPDAEIITERFLGIPKSLIAVYPRLNSPQRFTNTKDRKGE